MNHRNSQPAYADYWLETKRQQTKVLADCTVSELVTPTLTRWIEGS